MKKKTFKRVLLSISIQNRHKTITSGVEIRVGITKKKKTGLGYKCRFTITFWEWRVYFQNLTFWPFGE